jgi:hypothetical protein
MSRTKLVTDSIAALMSDDSAAQAAARAALAADEEERKPPGQRLREALGEVRLIDCHFGAIKWDMVDTFITGERVLLVRIEWRGDMHRRGAQGGTTEDLFLDWRIRRETIERATKAELQDCFRHEVERLVRGAFQRSWIIEAGSTP